MNIEDPNHMSFVESATMGWHWYEDAQRALKPLDFETVRFRPEPFVWDTCRADIWDSEPDPKLRLRHMIQIGEAFGISSWIRKFNDSSGTFSYEAEIETPDRKIKLRFMNASQGKCKIIKETKMIEVTTFRADCTDEDILALGASPEGEPEVSEVQKLFPEEEPTEEEHEEGGAGREGTGKDIGLTSDDVSEVEPAKEPEVLE